MVTTIKKEIDQNLVSEYDRKLAEQGLRRTYRVESVPNSNGLCYREVIVKIESKKKTRTRKKP